MTRITWTFLFKNRKKFVQLSRFSLTRKNRIEKISTNSYSSIFRFETIYCVTSVKRKETFTLEYMGIEYMGIFENVFHFQKHPTILSSSKKHPSKQILLFYTTNNSRFYRWKKPTLVRFQRTFVFSSLR